MSEGRVIFHFKDEFERYLKETYFKSDEFKEMVRQAAAKVLEESKSAQENETNPSIEWECCGTCKYSDYSGEWAYKCGNSKSMLFEHYMGEHEICSQYARTENKKEDPGQQN